MRRLLPLDIPPWALPLIVFALIAPSVAAFAIAGPQLGLAVGALTAGAVVVVAARSRFDEPIEIAQPPDRRYRLLVVAAEPLDQPDALRRIGELVAEGSRSRGDEPAAAPKVRVVAPAIESRAERWTSDVGPARAGAGGALAISLAALADAGLDVDGRVGDGDAVQAVEDALRTYPAQEVVVLTGGGIGSDELDEVRRRLDRPVRELSSRPALPGPGRER